jgi:hypothetical protein
MAFQVGTATDHNNLIDIIRNFVSATLPLAERHTILRNTTELSPVGDASNEKVIILQAPGLSGTEQIFYGLKVYKSVSSDYYNYQIDGFTGFVGGNTFESQPGSVNGTGVVGIGVTLWNQAIPYWLVANGQGFVCGAKVQNSYIIFGAGLLLKFATFGQYPYPLVVQGNLPTATATRYSDTAWISGWKGNRNNFRLRFTNGVWLAPQTLPWQQANNLRNTNNNSNTAAGFYGLHAIDVSDTTGTGNIYGSLENLFYISGFNNAAENTLVFGGITYVVLRDGTKTGNNDYIALKLA